EDGIRDFHVTGVQTCALPIYMLKTHLSAYRCSGTDMIAGNHFHPDAGGMALCHRHDRVSTGRVYHAHHAEQGQVVLQIILRQSLDRKSVVEGKSGDSSAGSDR